MLKEEEFVSALDFGGGSNGIFHGATARRAQEVAPKASRSHPSCDVESIFPDTTME